MIMLNTSSRFLPLLLLAVLFIPIPAQGDQGLNNQVRAILLQGIETNFSGDYVGAAKTFSKVTDLDPGHPAQDFYQASVLFWRNALDTSNPQYDEEIQGHLTRTMEKAQSRLNDDGDRLESLHYLGLAYTYQGRLEAQRGRYYTGGTHGEEGRVYLEEVLEACALQEPADRHPACDDVTFPLGAYGYFAGLLPSVLQKFSFLWFLPRGTTEEGLKQLEQARRTSDLHRLGATGLLARIFTLFEKGRGAQALALSSELTERFPDNPALNIGHAEILLSQGKYGEAAALAGQVLDKVKRGVRNYDETAALAAALIQAEAAMGEGDPDRAAAILNPLRADIQRHQNMLTPKIDLLQGMLEDLRGNRSRALAFYVEASRHKGRTGNRQASKAAERYMKVPYRNRTPQEAP
jgi:tetratricopeptide (TPR) repeat protein